MHELSIATAVLGTAIKHADGRPVSVVSMRAGHLRQVVPDSLQFYWGIVARDTSCAHARLDLIEVPLALRCRDCQHAWEPASPVFRCPRCASVLVEVTAGEELEVDYIEVEEQEAACIGHE
jgi:hydrogenase nickel incorporation protein HypA/HybF